MIDELSTVHEITNEDLIIAMSNFTEEAKESTFKDLKTKQKTEVRKNWKACPLSNWNSTTFRDYMNAYCKAKFKIEYACGNVRQENAMISSFVKKHGREVTKEFIYACMKTYKGNRQYPIPSFHFMITYMKDGHLPAILYKRAQEEERRKELEAQKNVDFVDYSEMF